MKSGLGQETVQEGMVAPMVKTEDGIDSQRRKDIWEEDHCRDGVTKSVSVHKGNGLLHRESVEDGDNLWRSSSLQCTDRG
ncbi:unnamed protein product [Lampetra planeri]